MNQINIHRHSCRSNGENPLLRIVVLPGLAALLIALMVCGIKIQAAQTLFVPGGTIPEAVSDAAAGIVRVQSQCLEGERLLEEHLQSGFLVGAKGSEPFVVTAASGLTFDKKKIRKEHQLEENAQLTERLRIIFHGDTILEASCLGSSDQKNLAVLKLAQSLTDRYTLSFSKDAPTDDMHLWLLSFPLDLEKEQKEMNYSERTVRTLEGVLMERSQDPESGTRYLLHTVTEDAGSLGAPVLDEHGWVLGMNVIAQKQRAAAISAAEIMSFLELHKLAYSDQSAQTHKQHSKWIYILGVLLLAAAAFMGRQILSYRKLKNNNAARGKKTQGGLSLLAKKGRLLHLQRQEEIRIDSDRFVLGSARERTDYLIEGNRKVSRTHAAVTYEKGTYYITDLHSTNGTRVNGQLLIPEKPQKLADGDLIEIAGIRFAFRDK